jgi:hypothetical protein
LAISLSSIVFFRIEAEYHEQEYHQCVKQAAKQGNEQKEGERKTWWLTRTCAQLVVFIVLFFIHFLVVFSRYMHNRELPAPARRQP